LCVVSRKTNRSLVLKNTGIVEENRNRSSWLYEYQTCIRRSGKDC
jgi:hypothetical protein